MKKLFFSLLITLSTAASANINCDQLSKLADDNGVMYGTKYMFTLQGPKGFRSNFHSAPSAQCSIKNLFLIPNDTVIAYQQFQNENYTWFYVMYIDKNGNDTTGWMKEKDFKMTSRLSLNALED